MQVLGGQGRYFQKLSLGSETSDMTAEGLQRVEHAQTRSEDPLLRQRKFILCQGQAEQQIKLHTQLVTCLGKSSKKTGKNSMEFSILGSVAVWGHGSSFSILKKL
jgi:hypothetical protein